VDLSTTAKQGDEADGTREELSGPLSSYATTFGEEQAIARFWSQQSQSFYGRGLSPAAVRGVELIG
jgi:hypothetical protein